METAASRAALGARASAGSRAVAGIRTAPPILMLGSDPSAILRLTVLRLIPRRSAVSLAVR